MFRAKAGQKGMDTRRRRRLLLLLLLLLLLVFDIFLLFSYFTSPWCCVRWYSTVLEVGSKTRGEMEKERASER